MKYFNAEDSKKLGELGLEHLREFVHHQIEFGEMYAPVCFSTLDICELENAKKLWGTFEVLDITKEDMDWYGHMGTYTTLTDEERINYVKKFI